MTYAGVLSRKFYSPNNLENRNKMISALEQNGSRIKQFRQLERSDIDDGLLKWF